MAAKETFLDPVYSSSRPLVEVGEVDARLRALPGPVALTGGTGFVGSHLVDLLCGAGVMPRCLVRDPAHPRWIGGSAVEWVEGDLADVDSLCRLVEGAGTVFHLAGVLRGADRHEFMEGNRGGTARLVSAVRDVSPSARVVYVSSQAAVGPSEDFEGVPPDAEGNPVSAYGRSKLAAEEEIRTFAGDWRILRPPAIFGPRDTDVFEFFRMASRGLLAVPSGRRKISVAFVRDVVRAVLAAGAVGRSEGVYHVAAPGSLEMEDMLRTIAAGGRVSARVLRIPPWILRAAGGGGSLLRILGMRRVSLSRDKAEEILARHWVLEAEESHRELGLEGLTAFSDGVPLTWSWCRRAGWLP